MPLDEKDAAGDASSTADVDAEEARVRRRLRRHNLERFDHWAHRRNIEDAEMDQLRTHIKAISAKGTDISQLRKMSARLIRDLYRETADLEHLELYSSDEEWSSSDSDDDQEMAEAMSATHLDNESTQSAGSAAVTVSTASDASAALQAAQQAAQQVAAQLAAQQAAQDQLAAQQLAQQQALQQQQIALSLQQPGPSTAPHQFVPPYPVTASPAPSAPPAQQQLSPRQLVPGINPEHCAALRRVKAFHDDVLAAEKLITSHINDVLGGAGADAELSSLADTYEAKYKAKYAKFEDAESSLRIDHDDNQWQAAAAAMEQAFAKRMAQFHSVCRQAPAVSATPSGGTELSAAASATLQIAVQARRTTYDITKKVKEFRGGYVEYNSFSLQWKNAEKDMADLKFTEIERFWALKQVIKGRAAHCVDLADTMQDVMSQALGRLERKYRDDTLQAKKLFEKMRIKRGTPNGEFHSMWEDILNDAANLDDEMEKAGISMYELTYLGRFESSMDDDQFEDWRIWIANQLAEADKKRAEELRIPFARLPEEERLKRASLYNRDTMLQYVQARATTTRASVQSRMATDSDDDMSGGRSSKRSDASRHSSSSSKRTGSVSTAFHGSGGGRSDRRNQKRSWSSRRGGRRHNRSRSRSVSRSPSPRPSTSSSSSKQPRRDASKQSRAPAAAASSSAPTCAFCKVKGHMVTECRKLSAMSTLDIRCWLQTSRRCFGCYAIVGPAHNCSSCCTKCNQHGHSTPLHDAHSRVTVPPDYKIPVPIIYSQRDRSKKPDKRK